MRLPRSYVEVLHRQNGGYLRDRCFPTTVAAASWAPDHLAVDVLYGIGTDNESGIDHAFGSRYLIGELGYPDIGVVVFGTPRAGTTR